MVQPLLKFETNRLIARKLEESDLELLHAMNQNEEVMATLGGICDFEETQKRLAWNLNQWREFGFGLWLLFEKSSGNFVGRGGIRRLPVDGIEETEIAYALVSSYWNKGLATEIAKECVRIGFEHYRLRDLIAITQKTNEASRRVIEKSGFVYEKEIMHYGALHVIYRQLRTL